MIQRRTRLLGAVLGACLTGVVLMVSSASDRSGAASAAPSAETCGLPRGDDSNSWNKLPRFASLPGAEIVATEIKSGILFASMNVRMSVAELRDAVRSRIPKQGFRILHEDFEGFEAEIFVTTRGETGVIRMARSRCDNFSSLSFQLPTPD